MDRTEDDMKYIGFFEIFNQSFKTIFSRKKIFTQITIAFILPLSLIFIIQLELSQHVFPRITNKSLPYNTHDSPEPTAIDWLYYALYTVAYYIFLTLFSVLSTASVTFTVASVYTGREVVFHDVIIVIRNIWKRLCITFIFICLALFIYNVVVDIIMAIFNVALGFWSGSLGVMSIILVLSAILFLYLSVVFQLASVVTVLENVHGFNALKKSKDLANGKKIVGMGIAFVLYGFYFCLMLVFLLFVEHGHEVFKWAMIWRVMMGILCGVLSLMCLLVFIVTQTLLYLVCKSYHQEAIDKLGLSTFLSAYMEETVVYPRSSEEIQLGRTQPLPEQV